MKTEDQEVLADGEVIRVPIFTIDGVQKAVAGNVSVPVLHRPGYARLSDAQVRDKAAAYVDYNTRVSGAWKKPPALPPELRTDMKTAAPAADHYGKYDSKLGQRWRGTKAA